MTQRTIVLALAILAGMACAPKKDTAPPDADKACTEEAKQCADGSSVVREGPNCEFPACPGEGEGEGEAEAEPDAEPSKDEGAGEAEPADASEPPPAEGE